MRLGLEAGAETLDLAVELDIRGVPIDAGALVENGVDATLAPLRERGLSVCQIGAFGFNPLAPDEGQKALLSAVIPLAAETGCPYIVINGGNYHPNSFGAVEPRNYDDAALDEVAAVLAPVVAQAEAHGARIAIEAYLKTAVGTPEAFLSLQAKVGSPALVANVDVTSLYDYWALVDPTASVAHTCNSLAGHYGLGHIKEIGLHEGFHLQAGLVPLGEGPTDWRQVLSLMAPHLPADSWLILEHVLSADEARSSVALLRRAAEEAGVTLT